MTIISTVNMYMLLSLMGAFSIYMVRINGNSRYFYYRGQAYFVFGFFMVTSIALAVFRDFSVGTDTIEYVNIFNAAQSAPDWIAGFQFKTQGREPLFMGLCYAVNKLGGSIRTIFFIGYTTIFVSLYYTALYAYKKTEDIQKKDYFRYLPCMLLFLYYIYSFNVFRNMWSISICMLSLVNMDKNKWKTALVEILVAVMIHYTAVVFLAVYLWLLLMKKRPQMKTKRNLIAVSVLIFLFMHYGVQIVQNNILKIGYESYLQRKSNIMAYLSPVVIAIISIALSEQIIKENSFAEKCIALIPIRIATIATYSYGGARLGYFFAIPEMYLISMILICIMRKSKSKIGVWLSKMFVVVFVAQEYIRFIKNLVEASGVVPYLLG